MKFRAAIGEYIRDQRSLGRLNSDNSIRIYMQRLNVLAEHVGNRDPRTVGRNDVKAVLARWRPASQSHARSIYVSFFDWCEQEGYTDGNPARKTPKPKVKPAERYRLTLAETAAMAGAPETLREYRAVHLALLAGLRNQELRGVQGRHFQRDGWIWISADIAKGGRERWVPVTAALEPVVAEIRAHTGLEDYVLPALRWSDRLTTMQREVGSAPSSSSTLVNLVRRVGKRAGIAAAHDKTSGFGPHTLRHAFCDHVRRVTGDVAITQALMGHKNIATTQGYMSKPTLDELAAAMNRYPRQNTPDQPVTPLVGANGPSHSEALLSDPLFCLGTRLGAANPVIQLYAEHFRSREVTGA